MAGMLGIKRDAIPIDSMLDAIRDFSVTGHANDDRSFLSNIIYPKFKDMMLAHDSYHCEKFPNSVPFPIRRYEVIDCMLADILSCVGRLGGEFVGSVCAEGNICTLDPNLPETPLKCRKRPEWRLG